MSGKPWVVILGASSGFGAAAARAFAAQGHPIFGAHMDRRGTMPQVEALVAELEGYGVPVIFHNGNAAAADNRTEALDRLAEAAGENGVGVLLHSLAFGTLRPYFGEDRPLAQRQMEMTLDVMAHSLVYWTQDLVARNLIGEGGRIYAMTSSGSLACWPSYGAVSAAKCALESHIRQIAVELAPKRITANAIMAGVTQTPALSKIPGSDAIVDVALKRNPHGRLTTPEDVASCLVALAGPGTAWMTGNVIKVDGGEAISG
ncbi:MAG: SDR family oxidoreductase [Deltaproteobacteria bacterium]|nr:MAG: SDR family oxidoreductase [Deltaproteobacteria bacterium]